MGSRPEVSSQFEAKITMKLDPPEQIAATRLNKKYLTRNDIKANPFSDLLQVWLCGEKESSEIEI